MNKIFYLIFFFSFGLLVSCNQDKDVFIPQPLFTQGIVSTSISGQVLDALNQPLQGVLIQLDQTNQQTDENGFFQFPNVQVNAQSTMLTASKNGYFEGGRVIIPAEASNSQIKIQLIEKNVVANFEGAMGGEMELPDGTVLEVPTDAVLSANGTGYNGEVQGSAFSMNPEFLEGLEKMPTDLKGKNVADEEKLLESFAMINFEWSDANQQKLTIVPGKKVTIHIPVSNGLLANAPLTIPLWNLENGTWRENGIATLENGNYVAEIGKSGAWNCARPHDFISVKGWLRSENNQVLSNMPFQISLENGGVTGYGFLDDAGIMVANVAKNSAAQIKILDDCDDLDYLAPITALNADALINTVKISNSSDFSHFGGTLLDCNNNMVQNGYIILSVNTKTYFFSISDGKFKGDINACNFSTATLVAYDVENQKQSEPLQLEVLESVEAGEISVCF